MRQFKVAHWQYNDGWRYTYKLDGSDERIFEPEMVGWFCWVYGDSVERADVIEWMKETMTGEYEACERFNGGNPIVTVHIKEEADAAVFKLRWL